MGFLEIQLLDARELSYVGKSDTGRVDPYCEFRIVSKQQLDSFVVSSPKQGKVKEQQIGVVKSRRIKNTTNPDWNDKLLLECPSLENQVLIITVMSYGALFHSNIGEATLDISALRANHPSEHDVELQRPGKGKLHFILTYVEQKSSEKIIKTGLLEKRGKFKNLWQTRYFVLNTVGLYWYSNNTLSQALGALTELSHCKVVTEDPSATELRETLSLGTPRSYFAIKSAKKNYHFKAKTESERLDWILALQSCGCESGILRPPSPTRGEDMTKSQEELIVEQLTSEPPEPPPFPSEDEKPVLRDSTEQKAISQPPPQEYAMSPKSKKVSGKSILDLGKRAKAFTKRATKKGDSMNSQRCTEAEYYMSDPEETTPETKKKSILGTLRSKQKKKDRSDSGSSDHSVSYSLSQPVSPTRSPSMTPINQSRETVPTFSRSESDPLRTEISGESSSREEVKKSNSFLVTIEEESTSVDTVEVTSISVPLSPVVVYMPMPETVRTFHAPEIIKQIKEERREKEEVKKEEEKKEEEKKEEIVKEEGIYFQVEFPKQYVIDFSELQMEKKLGQGSFGLVYQMKWRKQKCAVKQIIDLELNEDRFKEFHKEALLMMNLKHHPNVVTFYGVCTKPVCIVTEYLARGSLDVILRSNETIDIPRVLSIAKDIACGMLHLHLENIVHRDLAARNVLVTGDWTCKVSDFGLSRIANKSDNNTTATKTGPLLWMAPEALQQSKYSSKTDVYSFAITLIEILTRKSPYPNVDPIQVAIGVATTNMRPEIPTNTPDGLSALIKECWDRDPDNRPDFEAIYERLEKMEEEFAV